MKFFREHNWYLTSLVSLLCFTSVATIFSLTTGTKKEDLIVKQLIFIALGFVIYFFISKINSVYLNFNFINFSIFLTIIIFLVLTLVIGTNLNGAKRWIDLGAFTLQASEFAKIGVILISAHLVYLLEKDFFGKKTKLELAAIHNRKQGFVNFLIKNFSFVLVLIPSIFLIILVILQKSLSQSIVILIATLAIYFFSYLCSYDKFLVYFALVFVPIFLQLQSFWSKDLNLYFMIILFAIILILTLIKFINYVPAILFTIISLTIFLFGNFFVSNVVLKAYQQERIDAFLNEDDERYYWGENRQQREAKNAFGSGQIFGKGFGIGNDSRLSTVAFAESDFIFAAFGEQFGFFGVVVLFILYGLIIAELIRLSENTLDEKGRLICFGVAALFLFQLVIHVCVNLRILPNTGISLPLISYGGSSVFTFLISLGLVQAVTNSPKKASFVVDESWYEIDQ